MEFDGGRYAASYLTAVKPIFLLALAFSSKTRNVKEHLVERVERT